MEIQGEKVNRNFPAYGQFVFQGAYVYQLNLQDGFKLRGKITHLTAEDALKAGLYTSNSASEIKRILYIKDTLYTLSEGMVKAHGLVDLAERKAVQLP
jgi:inhibitor of cysteine peptidase